MSVGVSGRPKSGAAPVVPSVVAGLLVGFNLLGQAVALSGLVFAGALAVGLGLSTALLLASCIVATCALTAIPGMPPTAVGALQNVPVAALLPAAYLLADPTAAALSPESRVATMLALLGLSAVVTGVGMLILSALDVGRVVRLMPHPVSAGFLASAGMILILAGLSRIVDAPAPGLQGLARLPVEALPALALTLGLTGAIGLLARWRADLGPFLAVLLAFLAFYGVLSAQGLGPEDARTLGYLPPRSTQEALIGWHPGLFDAISWSFVSGHVALIAAAALIGILGAMLNLTGIELALRTDIETRRALSVTGLTNVGLGAMGGSISYVSSVNTVSMQALGARGPVARIVLLGFLAASLVYAPAIVAFTPTFVATGLLVYIGYTILSRWLLQQYRQQPLADWAISAGIVLVTVVFGILPAIGFGIVAASLIFAISYARLPVVTRLADLNVRRSSVDRGPAQSAVLDREAHRVLTLTLRGFLFFGSVEQLLEHVRAALNRPNRPDTILLDFARVSALDSAALAALQKLDFLARNSQVQIVITEASPAVAAALVRLEALLGPDPAMRFASATDAALEAAEDRLLTRLEAAETGAGARAFLDATLGDAALAQRVLSMMTREEVAAGQRLMACGDRDTDVILVERGQLAVLAPTPDGRMRRIQSLRPGALIGEIASYAGLPRAADVIAETAATVYRFNRSELDQRTRDDPELAAAWHRMIATALSRKHHRTLRMLRESR
ncbi:putative sulfate permease with cyclic nucleotide-binding domain [Dinoroseobacter shibae DFL 12 = DSM 16493]|uniref:Putative sulfate permease with cyclic nucleotide-binding domain n=1 Tax=Dinoroseobacter shibae (strain DSM 16493 / NCIMB 14021 / DFL 12) TaxID=398580 RepID=A8LQ95_DINSH|nr:cyclic nucleotide-binding domain-containing protein [Dinoroseobacter shibae]ABV92381.1 putative sulfate permease with cyclic nucleotide-binding domain [Dinoroseobacter shibae DFL 12 = DSM 16493]URF47327.1 cyclic nucleotide-binding domain-containing protein [Dinoroseobacter shibae]URF51638.1 cyclic nucleotide-binding domain-containing protein [Dinoroseobacter shibae]